MYNNILDEYNKDFIIDDRETTRTLNIIEDLIDTKLDLDINLDRESEIVALINSPEKFITDKEIIRKITNVREIIVKKSNLYYYKLNTLI